MDGKDIVVSKEATGIHKEDSLVEGLKEVNLNEKVDPEKRLKALRKKLREIEDLSKKDGKELSDEQLLKLKRKTEIENEINSLTNS